MDDQELLEQMRNLRDRQPWVLYDSVVVGPGAGRIQGWHNTYGSFAGADELRFNDGTRTEGNAGPIYCNQNGDTQDWAMDIYQTKVEFIAPFGWEEMESNAFDAGAGPFFWLQELPARSVFQVKLADSDEMLRVPGVMLPSNMGVEGAAVAGAASTFALPGHTGHAALTQGWLWPQPLEVPAKGKIATIMRLGTPIKQFYQALTALPATKNITVPLAAGGFQVVPYPNWYVIRVSHWGARSVQLRGARSS